MSVSPFFRLLSETLVLASANAGKIAEFTEFFSPWGTRILSLKDFNLPSPEENGANFEENALIKSRAAARGARLPALADDSEIR